MNAQEAALRVIVNIEVERQVADRLDDSVATAVKEIFMNAFQLATDSVAFSEKSGITGLIDVSIFQMVEIEQLAS